MKRFTGMFLLFGAAAFGAAPRVVSLSPATTELVFHLGGGDTLVGRSRACDTPEAVKKLPVAGDFAAPDLEEIFRLRADCVVTNDLVAPRAAEALQSRGVDVLLLPCRNVADYLDAVERLGERLGRQEEATREKARVLAALEKGRNSPRCGWRVLMILWQKPVVVAGEKTFCSELIRLSGAENVDFRGKSGYFTPDAEYLLRSDPDFILVFRDAGALKKHPVLKRLRAVRENRVAELADESLFQRPGPRWIDAMEFLREIWKKNEKK